jgi:hypothetical protein
MTGLGALFFRLRAKNIQQSITMKYHNPQDLLMLMDRLRLIASASAGHPNLRFHLIRGGIIEGRYEGMSLEINDKGYHSVAARVASGKSDFPTAVELADILTVEPLDTF